MTESWVERAVVEVGLEEDAQWSAFDSDAQLLSELHQNNAAGLPSRIIERTVVAGDWRPSHLGQP